MWIELYAMAIATEITGQSDIHMSTSYSFYDQLKKKKILLVYIFLFI